MKRNSRTARSSEDGIAAAPKDFTEVSPESIGVRVKLDAAADFLKSLKGQDVEVSLSSLTVTCDALRAGEQTINISVDPERAAALIAKYKSSPGVVAAGWTSGIVEMDRTIRFAAADWRDGDKLNRDKLAAAIAGVLTKTLSAKSAASAWNATTGKLKLTLQAAEPDISRARPHRDHRDHRAGGAGQTRRVRPADAVDRQSRHHDRGRGARAPKLNLADEAGSDEEGDPKDDNGSVDALAREFKGQRWDADKSAWK